MNTGRYVSPEVTSSYLLRYIEYLFTSTYATVTMPARLNIYRIQFHQDETRKQIRYKHFILWLNSLSMKCLWADIKSYYKWANFYHSNSAFSDCLFMC